MKTAGVICEYNPFHLGHQRHFELIRQALGEDTAIICLMSGNFVQRGVPAMWDKYTRAAAAISCGADLVLELPITKVLQSAEGFAFGGVEILARLSCIDLLSFGAECGSSTELMSLARRLDQPDCVSALQQHLSEGLPYAAAKQRAAGDTKGLLSYPNNILGVEYCRAILHFSPSIDPLVVQRNGDYHAEIPDAHEPSASAVRAQFPNGEWKPLVPQSVIPHLDTAHYELCFGERAMLSRLRALTDEEWEHCAHGSEGLWSKAMKASRSEATVEEIVNKTKSKRYPRTRIQRLLMCAYLGIAEVDLHRPINYARILAASPTGRTVLRKINNAGTFHLINPGERPSDTDYYRLETRACDLFTLFSSSDSCPCGMEQKARIKL